MKIDGHYIEVYGPYPVLMNVDGINIYTKSHVTDASDQVGRIYIGREKLKVRRIGQNAIHGLWSRSGRAYTRRAGQTTLRERTIKHRSSGQYHASEHLDRHGLW